MRAADSRPPLTLFSLKCPNDETFVLHDRPAGVGLRSNKEKAVSEGLRNLDGNVVFIEMKSGIRPAAVRNQCYSHEVRFVTQ